MVRKGRVTEREERQAHPKPCKQRKSKSKMKNVNVAGVALFLALALAVAQSSLTPASSAGNAQLVPTPKVKYQNDLYPNNFITNDKTSSLRLYWEDDQSSVTSPVRAYQLEYAVLENVPDAVSSIDFQVYASDIGKTTAGNTVQILTVRADSTLTGSETYQLGFSYGGELTMQPQLDHESLVVTPRIPVSATSAQLKASLEALENIQSVEVIRCDEITTNSGQSGWTAQCPYEGVGGYTYKIRFDAVGPLELNTRTNQLQPLASHDLPLLELYRNFISTPWSGSGPQILIKRLETSSIHPTICYEDPLSFGFQLLNPCSYEVKNLLPNSRYLFRLRVLTEDRLESGM